MWDVSSTTGWHLAFGPLAWLVCTSQLDVTVGDCVEGFSRFASSIWYVRVRVDW